MKMRRNVLRALLALSLGPWTLGSVLAAVGFAPRDRRAFALKGEREVLRSLGIDEGALKTSDALDLFAPEIAENGAVVPIELLSRYPDTFRALILVEKNPNTLAALQWFSPRMVPKLALRIKLAETSEVSAFVETATGWYVARKLVKVTVGGCGG
jgi:sulfur-oxidizing protein SoxY